jgi:hypothetical protein
MTALRHRAQVALDETKIRTFGNADAMVDHLGCGHAYAPLSTLIALTEWMLA